MCKSINSISTQRIQIFLVCKVGYTAKCMHVQWKYVQCKHMHIMERKIVKKCLSLFYGPPFPFPKKSLAAFAYNTVRDDKKGLKNSCCALVCFYLFSEFSLSFLLQWSRLHWLRNIIINTGRELRLVRTKVRYYWHQNLHLQVNRMSQFLKCFLICHSMKTFLYVHSLHIIIYTKPLLFIHINAVQCGNDLLLVMLKFHS